MRFSFTDKRSWFEANHQCYIRGGSGLLALEDKQEATFWNNKKLCQNFFTGAKQDAGANNFYWFTNPSFYFPKKYFPWASKQPALVAGEKELCTTYRSGDGGEWYVFI